MKLETRLTRKFSSVLFSLGIPFTGKKARFYFQLYKNPNEWVKGYSSRTQNGRYVLFHDYDNLELSEVVEELKWLQKKHSLSDYYVFKSPDLENSYHAVCLDTMPISEAYEIQKQTSGDGAFINSIKKLKTKEWILRCSNKGERNPPMFLRMLKSKKNRRIKSKAHANFLRKFGVGISKKGKWDNQTELTLVDYNTANRTTKRGVKE